MYVCIEACPPLHSAGSMCKHELHATEKRKNKSALRTAATVQRRAEGGGRRAVCVPCGVVCAGAGGWVVWVSFRFVSLRRLEGEILRSRGLQGGGGVSAARRVCIVWCASVCVVFISGTYLLCGCVGLWRLLLVVVATYTHSPPHHKHREVCTLADALSYTPCIVSIDSHTLEYTMFCTVIGIYLSPS